MGKLLILVFYGVLILVMTLGALGGYIKGFDTGSKLCNDIELPDNTILKYQVDIGYELGTNITLWKYKNETIWRKLI